MGARRELAQRERQRMKRSWRFFRRELLGYSQQRIAGLLGISRGQVARWESSESRELPDLGDLLALSKAMRVPLAELLNWIDRAKEWTP